ncbi:MAG: Stealth CR1 domain-containing protein [Fibrobacter sp.]|nr:Stealth CR1 domain-containing protein [Fibrobacter sp.]
MNSPIDIVVPWVNPNDAAWKKQYEHWHRIDAGVAAECRYRDFGVFKYTIMGMIKFCPWVRNIIIVLASPTQKEPWMDTISEKVRIVYHEDYIPKPFLPTFNSNVIEMFFHMIPGLASNFILFNDDFYVVQPTKETDFFVDNLPVDFAIPKHNWLKGGLFDTTQQNNQRIANRIHHKNTGYADFHFPIAYNKKTWIDTWLKYPDELWCALMDSRFRQPKNVTHWMFRHIQLGTGKFYSYDLHNNATYIVLGDGTSKKAMLDAALHKKVICLNEQEGLTFTYDAMKEFMQAFFKSMFE